MGVVSGFSETFVMVTLKNTLYEGQAVIIIIVGMVIALTIGLSIAAQSIINLQSSTDEEQSQRAFSAAEAGVERALSENQPVSNVNLGNNTVIREVTVDNITQNNLLLNDGLPALKNDPVDVWLSNYPAYDSPRSGTLDIYWGTQANCTEAAIEVTVISGASINTASTQKFAADPCTTRGNGFSQPGQNGFSTGTFTVAGTPLSNRQTISVTDGYIARIIPLYSSTTIGVISSGGLVLPSQGSRIESTGQVGETQRKITVYRGFPKVPYEFFPNAIFSP